MKLDYSLGSVPTKWIDGPLPLPGLGVDRIRIAISGTSDGPFPPVVRTGDLLPFRRKKAIEQHGITLLLEYIVGYNPPLIETPPTGKFYPAPGAPILGQVRVALNPEAIAAIEKNDEEDIPYRLTLSGVEFHHVKGEEEG